MAIVLTALWVGALGCQNLKPSASAAEEERYVVTGSHIKRSEPIPTEGVSTDLPYQTEVVDKKKLRATQRMDTGSALRASTVIIVNDH